MENTTMPCLNCNLGKHALAYERIHLLLCTVLPELSSKQIKGGQKKKKQQENTTKLDPPMMHAAANLRIKHHPD